MFTAVAHKSLAGAEGYFVEHLSQNDYYAAGEIRPGQWIGIGAERLGLSAGHEVNREQFCALCENQHPQTGQRLTQRQNAQDQRRCSASVENAGLGIELTHCCLRKEEWYEQTRTAALQCPRESQDSAAPFSGKQSGVPFMRTASDHSPPDLSMAEAGL